MDENEPIKGELVETPAPVAETALAPPGPSKKALAAKKHLEYVTRLDGRVRRTHTRIVEKIALAAKIDTGAPKPPGWTDEDYRIAQDARLGSREAPMYLAAAQKIVDSYKRAEVMAERDPSPSLNCDVQVFVQQNTYNYEVIEAESVEK